MSDWSGRLALITGATGGLGTEFAGLLAARKCDLVLTARSGPSLEALSIELRRRHAVRVATIPADLSESTSAELLDEALRQRGLAVDILVNNAGFGMYGEFLESHLDRVERMLGLCVIAPTSLAWRLGRRMAERGRGWILNVASIGAYQPSPLYAAYAASKSYVLNFSEALRRELYSHGITVTVLSPGVTRTGFLDAAGQTPSLYQRIVMMESRPVAEAGLRALERGHPRVVPGAVNKASSFGMRLLPRSWQAAIAEWAMRY